MAENINVSIMREMSREIATVAKKYRYRVKAYKYGHLNELVVCMGSHNPALDDEDFLEEVFEVARKNIEIDVCGDFTGKGVERL